MVARKRSTKAPHNPYLTSATPDDLGPANRIAYDIVAERRDLLPSVERIMNAGLDEDGTVGVLTLFRCSLTAAGDPNRDPRVAIASLLAGVGERRRDNRRLVTPVAEPLAAAPASSSSLVAALWRSLAPSLEEVRRARRRLHGKALVIVVLVAASYWALALSNLPLLVRLGAAGVLVLGLVAVGTSIMHDANHDSFSGRRWLNRVLAYTSDTLGASSWLWRIQHNSLHHGNANVAGFDADIALFPFARLAPSQHWHFWYRGQHIYMWPLYGFLALKNLLVSDLLAVITGRLDRQPIRQPRRPSVIVRITLGKLAHLGWAVVIPLMFNPWWAVLAFYLGCSWLVGFLLAIIFQLAHCVDVTTDVRRDRAPPRRRLHVAPAAHHSRHLLTGSRPGPRLPLARRWPRPPDRAPPRPAPAAHALPAHRRAVPGGLSRSRDHVPPAPGRVVGAPLPHPLAAPDERAVAGRRAPVS